MLDRIIIEESDERTKITIPLRRNLPFWSTYAVMLLGWIAGSIWALRELVRLWRTGQYQQIDTAFLIAYVIILLLIAAGWYWVGQRVWRNFQYHSSNREILFFYPKRLIVRRPFSLLGITDAYDLQYVSPFRFDAKVESLAFDYGMYRVPVGISLSEDESQALKQLINERFFPHHQADPDEDEDDEL